MRSVYVTCMKNHGSWLYFYGLLPWLCTRAGCTFYVWALLWRSNVSIGDDLKRTKTLALRVFRLWCFMRSKFIDVHYIWFNVKIIIFGDNTFRVKCSSWKSGPVFILLSSVINLGFWVQFCVHNWYKPDNLIYL